MKGIVFTEFFEMVDSKFSIEMSEKIIKASDLESGGVYTSVGTYHHNEMAQLVTNLSKFTKISASDLLVTFGTYLFGVLKKFFTFFENSNSSFDFLEMVDSYIHIEVRKLYPDAELPKFECERTSEDTLIMIYTSDRHLEDLAYGLMLGCFEFFKESITVQKEPYEQLPGIPSVRFTLVKQNN